MTKILRAAFAPARAKVLVSTLTAVLIAMPITPVLADNPRDPTMTPEAIARDAEIIRRLNREQLEYVRKRDARYAQGWRDYDAARNNSQSNTRDYADAQANYASARRQYERDMREWRQDVNACRSGRYEYCAR